MLYIYVCIYIKSLYFSVLGFLYMRLYLYSSALSTELAGICAYVFL